MKKIILITIFVLLGTLVNSAMAAIPVREALTDENVCDDQLGAAFGLCNAYCEAMDCDSDFPHASDNACNKVLDRFAQHTGTLPPCEAQLLECICWNTYTEAELVAAINAQPPVDLICQDETWEATMILDVAGFNPRLIAFAAPEEPEEPPFCEFEVGESGLVFHFLDTAMTSQCKQELSRLIPIIPGCL